MMRSLWKISWSIICSRRFATRDDSDTASGVSAIIADGPENYPVIRASGPEGRMARERSSGRQPARRLAPFRLAGDANRHGCVEADQAMSIRRKVDIPASRPKDFVPHQRGTAQRKPRSERNGFGCGCLEGSKNAKPAHGGQEVAPGDAASSSEMSLIVEPQGRTLGVVHAGNDGRNGRRLAIGQRDAFKTEGQFGRSM